MLDILSAMPSLEDLKIFVIRTICRHDSKWSRLQEDRDIARRLSDLLSRKRGALFQSIRYLQYHTPLPIPEQDEDDENMPGMLVN